MAVESVLLRADPSNADTIYIGSSGSVTTGNGYPLAPGETLSLEIDDIQKVYAISGTAAQTLAYIGSG
jgi:hypothetical protein